MSFCRIKETVERVLWKMLLKRACLLHIHTSSDKMPLEFVTKQRNRRNAPFFLSVPLHLGARSLAADMGLEKIRTSSQLGFFIRMVLWYTGHGINLPAKMVSGQSPLYQTEQVYAFHMEILNFQGSTHHIGGKF